MAQPHRAWSGKGPQEAARNPGKWQTAVGCVSNHRTYPRRPRLQEEPYVLSCNLNPKNGCPCFGKASAHFTWTCHQSTETDVLGWLTLLIFTKSINRSSTQLQSPNLVLQRITLTSLHNARIVQVLLKPCCSFIFLSFFFKSKFITVWWMDRLPVHAGWLWDITKM
jgi:hypothetical protein